jgi:hypothetical protein
MKFQDRPIQYFRGNHKGRMCVRIHVCASSAYVCIVWLKNRKISYLYEFSYAYCSHELIKFKKTKKFTYVLSILLYICIKF